MLQAFKALPGRMRFFWALFVGDDGYLDAHVPVSAAVREGRLPRSEELSYRL
jgi:hypothetical protein